MLALPKGPNRVGVTLPSPEDGNMSSYRNVAVSSYLEFRTMDKVQNPSDSRKNVIEKYRSPGCDAVLLL
jgi:hypothetical protein